MELIYLASLTFQTNKAYIKTLFHSTNPFCTSSIVSSILSRNETSIKAISYNLGEALPICSPRVGISNRQLGSQGI